MKEIVEKLRSVELELASEKGRFRLFALFLREGSPDVWDLVVSAPWIDVDRTQALRVLAEKARGALDPNELTKLSRIVLIEDNNPALRAVHQAIKVEHGSAEVQDSVFFGLTIKHAIIITSQRDEAT